MRRAGKKKRNLVRYSDPKSRVFAKEMRIAGLVLGGVARCALVR